MLALWERTLYLVGMFRYSLLAVLSVAVLVTAGCKRPAKSRQVAAVASTLASGVPSAAASAPDVTTSDRPSDVPPASFDGALPAGVANSGLTKCTARQLQGWAEIRCAAVNAEGGSLNGASIEAGGLAGEPTELKPTTDGTIRLVVPWVKGRPARVRVEWDGMTQELSIGGNKPTFTRVLPPAQAGVCARLQTTYDQQLTEIRSKQGAAVVKVTPKDVNRFPYLGRCQVAKQIAWALTMKQLSASGEGVNREVQLTLELVRVDVAGNTARATYGTLAFAPEGVQIPELMLYDYDNDGDAEVIVRQDVLARPANAINKPLSRVRAVFTYKGGKVQPYANLTTFGSGGVVAEQLEEDGRPDVGDYGPFVAWLPKECGRGKCPLRLVGPRFFLRSTLAGGFSAADDKADEVIYRTCRRTPKDLVEDIGSLPGKRKTALNVACARVRGDSTDGILAQLSELKTEMCLETQPNCHLYATLAAWARATPPRKVILPAVD